MRMRPQPLLLLLPPPPLLLLLLPRHVSSGGPVDPIWPGPACDPLHCECGGLDLSQFKGRVFEMPPDAGGSRVRFKMCENLTTAELPAGCRADELQSPASVLYNSSDETVCRQIGSFGPCWDSFGPEHIQCGMTFNDSRADGGELLVTWQFESGCINTFRVALSAGEAKAPRAPALEHPDSCYWETHWAGIAVPPAPPPPAPTSSSWRVAVTIVVAAGAVVVVVGGVGWWRRRQRRQSSGGERLLSEPGHMPDRLSGSE
jgi:hypothetical protein